MLNEFPERVEIRTRLPWGYIKDPEESGIAIRNEEALSCLKEAFDLLDSGQSYRNVLDFIQGQGYELSIRSLKVLWDKYRPDSEIKKNREPPKKKPRKKVDRKLAKKKKAIGGEKTRITMALRRLEKLNENKEDLEKTKKEIDKALSKRTTIAEIENQEVVQEIEKDRTVYFEPNPGPQTEFLSATELEVLYGGTAGGGKSYALIADPMRYFENKNFVGLLLRKTNDELRELIWKTKELYPKVFPKATFHEKASEWRFPSGARLWMSYLDRDDDVLRYQGQAYSWVGFDELTHWPTPFAWNYLRTRLRTAKGSGLEKSLSMRATTNPGNIGHAWVKRMFIDPAPPGESFWARDENNETIIDPETKLPLFRRRFIPAKLTDNPYYSDGEYRKNLLSLPEGKRKQLLEGDWTIADGAAFPEFNIRDHVIEPFSIDPNWRKFRACDYGYSSHSCVLWFAIDPSDNQLVVYREMYVSKKTGEQLAPLILEAERADRIDYGVLDSSVWHKRGEGPSTAEVMINKGVRWRPSDRSQGSRSAGYNRLHELLRVDEFSGRPGIVFFNTCRQIISDLQVIPSDPKGSDDIDDRFQSDHSYDALRYGIMSRPRALPWWAQESTSSFSSMPSDPVFGY